MAIKISGVTIIDDSRNIVSGAAATFTSNVTIGGTLTYEDVTNIDSVGVITAREGIKIPFDNKFLLLGESNDLSLAHTAGHSYIADTGTGDLRITGSVVRIQNAIQNKDIAVFNQNSSVDLYFNDNLKFKTTNTGAEVVHAGGGVLDVTTIKATDGDYTGIVTAQGFVGGGINTSAVSIFKDLQVLGGINVNGVATATAFSGDGSDLTNLPVSSFFTNTDVGIHTLTKVGIGTTNPIAQLDINVGSSVTALNIEGSEGQLFSVTNNLSSGSIFAVNDITGLPSVDVNADGTIQLAPRGTSEFVGIGTTVPTSKLHIVGNNNDALFKVGTGLTVKGNGQTVFSGVTTFTGNNNPGNRGAIHLPYGCMLVFGDTYLRGAIYNSGTQLYIQALNAFKFRVWDGNGMKDWLNVGGVGGQITLGGCDMGVTGSNKTHMFRLNPHKITMCSSVPDSSTLTKRFEMDSYGFNFTGITTVTGNLNVTGIATAGIVTATSLFGRLKTDEHQNLYIGVNAGSSNNLAACNIAIGHSAGNGLCGCDNVILGSCAGNGFLLGGSTQTRNVLIGKLTGQCSASSTNNVYIGYSPGRFNTSAVNNIAIGYAALRCPGSGSSNVALGSQTMRNATGGSNVALGGAAGCAVTGCYNVFLGCGSGSSTTSGFYNLLFGHQVQASSVTADSELVIGCCTGRWVCGDSSFNTTLAGISTAKADGTFLSKQLNVAGVGTFSGVDVTGGTLERSSTGNKLMFVGSCQTRLTHSSGSKVLFDFHGSSGFLGRIDAHAGAIVHYNGGNKTSAVFRNQGGVELYYDNAGTSTKRFQTKNTGAEVVGILTANTVCALNFTGDVDGNIIMGHCAGIAVTDTTMSGTCTNVFIGCCAGTRVCTGNNAVFIGSHAGRVATHSNSNIFIGEYAACNIRQGSNNVIVGKRAGMGLTQQCNTNASLGANANVFMGAYAGHEATMDCNVMIGVDAGRCNKCGQHNVFMGVNAGKGPNNTVTCNCGYANVVIGSSAGSGLRGGQYNVILGRNAGTSISTGENHIFIGCGAGTCQVAGYNNIYMGNLAGHKSIGVQNIFMGQFAGKEVTSGSLKIAIGDEAGRCGMGAASNSGIAIGHCSQKCATASNNVVVGGAAGFRLTCGLNTMMGNQTGVNATAACGNTFLGYYAAGCFTTGHRNTFVGCNAGYGHTVGTFNVMLGACSGPRTCGAVGECNIFIGGYTASAMCCGLSNIAIGPMAGRCLRNAYCNVFLGRNAGLGQTSGSFNFYVGNHAGPSTCGASGCDNIGLGRNTMRLSTGASQRNIAIGFQAGYCVTGNYNIFFGCGAGELVTSGSRNIIIGCGVDAPSATGNRQLAIGEGTGRWITGDSSFKVTLAGIVTATAGGAVCANSANLKAYAVDTDIFSITRSDHASSKLFRIFQDSNSGGGAGGPHINTFNRNLMITASTSAATDSGVYLKTTGEFGVGTNNPTSKLSVAGDACVSGVSTFSDVVKVGAGVTLHPRGEAAFAGVSTFSACVSSYNDKGAIHLPTCRMLTFGVNYLYGAIYQAGSTLTMQALNTYRFRVWDGGGMKDWMNVSGVGGQVKIGGCSAGLPGSACGTHSFITQPHKITMCSSVPDSSTCTKRFELDSYGIKLTGITTVAGNLNVTGVVTATHFYGDGSNLTGISGGGGGISTTFFASSAAGIHTLSKVGIGTAVPEAQLDVNVGSGVTALNISGSEGQLFSVTNNLTSGSIFEVNDVSGMPSIDVNADGTIQLAPHGTGELVGIGTTVPTSKLHVVGTLTAEKYKGDTNRNIIMGVDPNTVATSGVGTANVFIGDGAGKCNTDGAKNVFIGYEAGKLNTTPSSNVAIGNRAGCCLKTGGGNTFLGVAAGMSNCSGTSNVFLGSQAALNATTSKDSVVIGLVAGKSMTTGNNNVLVGRMAGCQMYAGNSNVYLGNCSGYCTQGNHNLALGQSSGHHRAGSKYNRNILLGTYAGMAAGTLAVGNYDILIGYNAGVCYTGSCSIGIGQSIVMPTTAGMNQLAIGQQCCYWITGSCDYNVGIGISIPTSKLHVVGDTCVSGVSTFSGGACLPNNSVLQIGQGSYKTTLHNDTNLYLCHSGLSAFFVKSNDFQIAGAGVRNAGLTYDGTIFRARTGIVELGYEFGNGDAGIKLRTSGIGITVTGQIDTTDINATGIITATNFTKTDGTPIASTDIAINTLSSSSGTGGGSASFNGTAYRFTLSEPPDTSVYQLQVSINGVIQKPNAGSSQPSEGFAIDGNDIIFGSPPPAGSPFFITTFKTVGISSIPPQAQVSTTSAAKSVKNVTTSTSAPTNSNGVDGDLWFTYIA